MTNIYIGNLPYSVTEGQLRALFQDLGTVTSFNLSTDKYSGESKGFGVVEMAQRQEAEVAIKTLNDTAIDGRTLSVNLARPKLNNAQAG